MLPTAKGHLDQEQANLQSTKRRQNQENDKDFTQTDRKAIKIWQNAATMYVFTQKKHTLTK